MNLKHYPKWKALDGQPAAKHRQPANKNERRWLADVEFEAAEPIRASILGTVLLHFLEELRRGCHSDVNVYADVVSASEIALKSPNRV